MTARWWAPVLLAAIACWVALPRPDVRGPSISRREPADANGDASVWWGAAVVSVIAAAIIARFLFGADGWSLGSLMATPLAVLLVFSARAMIRGWRSRTAAARGRAETIELCDALIAELQAGLPAQQVVANACRPWPELAPVVATARLGGDLAQAFRTAALRPGAQGLRLIAASWEVSGRSGAGLAAVLERVSMALREDEEARAEVAAALGSPRATAKLLVALPLVGLGLGTAMGVDPAHFLASSLAGNACLFVGIVLALIGHWWVERLAIAVES